jgi:hypothetical protein
MVHARLGVAVEDGDNRQCWDGSGRQRPALLA